MELWIVLAALYGFHCLVWLPGRAVAFVRLGGASWITTTGPGWRLLHPFPSGAAVLAARLPVSEHEGRLHGPAAPTWLSARAWHELGPPVEATALADAEVRGQVVRASGRPFAGALSHEQAEAMADFLRALGRAEGDERSAVVERELERTLSLARYRDAEQRVERVTRWLRWSSDLYWMALFVGLPVTIAFWGSERALFWSLPAVAALHLSTLAAYAWASSRLHPGRIGALVESVLAAAVYPPLLLRAWHELRTRELASFHPAAAASAALPAEEGRAFLRAEIVHASARARAGTPSGLGLDALECRALWTLASELGESEETMLAPPQRRDPLAESYCPACLSEYRRACGTCSDCGLELVDWLLPA